MFTVGQIHGGHCSYAVCSDVYLFLDNSPACLVLLPEILTTQKFDLPFGSSKHTKNVFLRTNLHKSPLSQGQGVRELLAGTVCAAAAAEDKCSDNNKKECHNASQAQATSAVKTISEHTHTRTYTCVCVCVTVFRPFKMYRRLFSCFTQNAKQICRPKQTRGKKR